jgi:hypothetical protein
MQDKIKQMFLESNLNESARASLSRAFHHFKNNDIAIMTAFRQYDDNGDMLTLSDNRKRNKQLKRSIRAQGYGFIPVLGYYPEVNPSTGEKENVSEESILIVDKNKNGGTLEDFVYQQGVYWDQDSVLFKPAGESGYLIGTNDSAGWIKKGEKVSVGTDKFNSPDDIFTKLHGNKKFSFSEEINLKEYESFFVQSAKKQALENKYGYKK